VAAAPARPYARALRWRLMHGRARLQRGGVGLRGVGGIQVGALGRFRARQLGCRAGAAGPWDRQLQAHTQARWHEHMMVVRLACSDAHGHFHAIHTCRLLGNHFPASRRREVATSARYLSGQTLNEMGTWQHLKTAIPRLRWTPDDKKKIKRKEKHSLHQLRVKDT